MKPVQDDAVRAAIRRAGGEPVSSAFCVSVYFDGKDYYVRASEAAPPKGGKLVCIAQRSDGDTVELCFPGAGSEFIKI